MGVKIKWMGFDPTAKFVFEIFKVKLRGKKRFWSNSEDGGQLREDGQHSCHLGDPHPEKNLQFHVHFPNAEKKEC